MADFQLKATPIQLDAESRVVNVSEDERIVEFLACREIPIQRFDWFKGEMYLLSFSHEPGAVNLDRVKAGQCMHLSEHTGMSGSAQRLGKVISAEVRDKALYTRHKINKTKLADEYWNGEVLAGTEPGVSIEADPKRIEVLEKAVYEEDPDTGARKLVKPAHLLVAEWEFLAVANADVPAVLGAKQHKPTSNLSKEQQQALEQQFHMIQLSGETGYEFLFESLSNEATDSPMEKLEANMDKEIETKLNGQITQLSDDVRNLKLSLGNAEKQATEAREQLHKLQTENQYWQQRARALSLYALENKLTEEDYKLDFSEDAKVDIERLTSMSADDARIELKMLARALDRSAMKQPADRVSPEGKAKLSNESIKSAQVDEPGKVQLSEQDALADRFLANYQPRKIGQ